MYMPAMSGPPDSITLTPREAASGVLGSVSLACWIFLLVPQLIENYKYGSADAVSLTFIFVWFIGDIANLIGSLWAQLVPVIVAIAVYFCLADGILICQCIYYNIKNTRLEAASTARKRKHGHGHGHHDDRALSGETTVDESDAESEVPDPTTPLLSRRMSENLGISASASAARRRRSSTSMRRRYSQHHVQDSLTKILEETEPGNTWVKNCLSVFGICAAGAAGWVIAWQSGVWRPTGEEQPGRMAAGAQVFGYLSALCYLG
ncbi:hypothetical protein ACJ72_08526 [Emergomyces africanus]|uniref:Vacuolar membrane PQ loop repeat protein n=1 Tax=Emergomyces africanus TaxID=1955775 RepID=A0A1B7NK84_9EURO|nr:hypothetical protein ACJ72_08526 [Emergomyces africanus]